jgi:Zn-dependent M28 family amino/carboxypeptidase
MKKVVPLAVVCALLCAPPAFGTESKSDSKKLRDAVNVKGMLAHEAALNTIGELANGNRLAGTKGHDASALYVGVQSAFAGLRVREHEFDYDLDVLADWKAPILKIVTPGERHEFVPGIFGAIPGGDFGSNYGTTSGDVTGKVWAVDLNLPAPVTPNSNTSACEPEDFAGMPAGSIALVQRGTCPFVQKWTNAYNAGAGAMVMFNEYNPGNADRDRVLWFDVPSFGVPTPPMTTATQETALHLMNGVQNGDTGLRARVRLDWRPGTYDTSNVIAETKTGDANKTIVVGAHLDSVGTGAGINDNGSGSAALLEMARHINKMNLRNKVRFVWFSAEESGLLGSEAYVASLPQTERDKIAAMLNFDMIASPNFARFVYDGDQVSFPPGPGDLVAPPGSDEIEELFLDYFASQGLANEPTAFDGRSDYGPFMAAGIPSGGLFTGAEELKTPAQAALYGGTAGEQFDPCYHLGCDDFFNLSHRGYEQMADAAAHVLVTLAQAKTLPGGGSAPVATAAARTAAKADVHDVPGRVSAGSLDR